MSPKTSKRHINQLLDKIPAIDEISAVITLFLGLLVFLITFWDLFVSHLEFITDSEKISIPLATISGLLALLAVSIYRNNMLMKRVEGQLEFPFEINNTLKDFDEEIKANIKNAEEVWLLSRTGINMWHHYFMHAFNGRKPPICRFLFITPELVCHTKKQKVPSCAMCMHKTTMSNLVAFKTNVVSQQKQTLDIIKNCFNQNNANNNIHGQKYSELRTIDYLLAWTLLMINPSSKNGKSIVYVEFATYNHNDKFQRPVSRITLKNIEHFDLFVEEFCTMWEKAIPW